MECIHDPGIECTFKQECLACPIAEGIMRDYPH